jgi:hypothetical protein
MQGENNTPTEQFELGRSEIIGLTRRELLGMDKLPPVREYEYAIDSGAWKRRIASVLFATTAIVSVNAKELVGADISYCSQDDIACFLREAELSVPMVDAPGPIPAPETANAQAVEAAPMPGPISVESLPDLGIQWLPPSVRYWGNEILAAAATHQVDPQLMAIIVTLESGGWPEALSRAEAQGLMQIWPPTGRSLASVLGIAEGQYDLFDPATNTNFGALKLRQLLDRYQPAGETTPSDYTVQMVATGYNGGEGRANNLLAGLPIPHETSVYSGYAVEMWQQRHLPTSPAFERWQSPDYGNGNILITKAHEYFAPRGVQFAE